jgi:5'-nucleotidase
MLILLTNDDGVYAEGLRALAREFSRIRGATVHVIAPERECSAGGHAVTLNRPLHIAEVALGDGLPRATSVTGTPADCVKLAVKALLDRPPDLIVSGVNRGPNLSTDVFYSGTVSAAVEGAIHGIPSLAVSLTAYEGVGFDVAARITRLVAGEALSRGLPPHTLLNINVPPLDIDDICGVAVTRLGVARYRDVFDRRTDPRGRTYFWLTGEFLDGEWPDDTDVAAVRRNEVSVTPIQLDLTDHGALEAVRSWGLALPGGGPRGQGVSGDEPGGHL